MSEFDYSRLSNKDALTEICSRSLNTIDGLWFLAVEQKYGLDTAVELDIQVWRQATQIHANRLLKTFAFKEDTPIQTLIKMLQVDPIFAIFRPKVVTLTDGKAVIRFLDCPPQKARIRDNRDEFQCEPVELATLTSYAEVVNPRIKVTCLACLPDEHPREFWCEWQFKL